MTLITRLPHTLSAMGLSEASLTRVASHCLQRAAAQGGATMPLHVARHHGTADPHKLPTLDAVQESVASIPGARDVTLFDISRHAFGLFHGAMECPRFDCLDLREMPATWSLPQVELPHRYAMDPNSLLGQLCSDATHPANARNMRHDWLWLEEQLTYGYPNPIRKHTYGVQHLFELTQFLWATSAIAIPEHLRTNTEPKAAQRMSWQAMFAMLHAQHAHRHHLVDNIESTLGAMSPHTLLPRLTNEAQDWSIANTLALDAEFRDHAYYTSAEALLNESSRSHTPHALNIEHLWTLSILVAATGRYDDTARKLTRDYLSATLSSGVLPLLVFSASIIAFREQWRDDHDGFRFQRWSRVEHEFDRDIAALHP